MEQVFRSKNKNGYKNYNMNPQQQHNKKNGFQHQQKGNFKPNSTMGEVLEKMGLMFKKK